MTPDDRGRWFRIYARSIRQHRKFRNLNLVELGAWLALRSEAELRDSAAFMDREEAALVLRRRGGVKCAALVAQLIAFGLFDEREDGSVTVHDRADHDRPKAPSDDPEKVRERVNRHRSKRRNDPSNDASNDGETTRYKEGNETRARAPESGAGAGAVSDSPSDSEGVQGESLPAGWNDPDLIVYYHDLTQKYPSEGVITWLNRLADDHPEEAIIRCMGAEYAKDSNLGTLLSRTENAVKLDLHKRQRADEKARAAAQAKAEAPYRQREREATPEEREQAKFQQQAIRLGLKLGIPVPTEVEEVRKFVMKHGSAA